MLVLLSCAKTMSETSKVKVPLTTESLASIQEKIKVKQAEYDAAKADYDAASAQLKALLAIFLK